MFDRLRVSQDRVWIFLVMIIAQVAATAFFQLYWLKDNQWVLKTDDLNVKWVSVAEPRVIPTADPAKATYDRSEYQLATPDDRWHGRVTSKLSTQNFQSWMAVGYPVIITCLVGLYLGRRGREKPEPSKIVREEFATT